MAHLATLSPHGNRLKSAGWLPSNFPALARVRKATADDNVATEWVAEDYDGAGVVALKREDFQIIA